MTPKILPVETFVAEERAGLAGLLETYLNGQLCALFQRYKPRGRKALSNDEQILAYFLRHRPLS